MDLDNLGCLLHPLPPPPGAQPDSLRNVQARMRALLGRCVPPGSGLARGDGPAEPGLPAAPNADGDAPASNPPTRGGVSAIDAATTTGSKDEDGLLGRLDALAESNRALRREYESSLCMLWEVHTDTELRNS